MAFDFEKLKSVAKRLGGILVMEGSEPQFVLLSYEQYTKLESATGTGGSANPNGGEAAAADEHLMEQLNNEILALKEEIRQKESQEAQLV